MQRIHTKGLFLGGIAAGLVLLAGEVIIESAFGSAMESWLQSLGRDAPGEAAMAGLALTVLGVGFTTVWLYAAIEPRHGRNAGTVLRAATVAWVLACLMPTIHISIMVGMPNVLFWVWTAGAAVQIFVATTAGAALYNRQALAHAATIGAAPARS